MIGLKPSLNFFGDFLEIVSAARSIHAARGPVSSDISRNAVV
jgi:hypothetical protein